MPGVARRGKNLAFSDRLTTGRGVHKGGVIFLPPAATAAPAPPPPAGCGVIEIPPRTSDPRIEFVLKKLGARLPEHARCLDPSAEVAYAKGIYGNSLAYDDIYVSDGVGASNRPFTLALPYSGGWIVVLNLGPSLVSKPGSDKSTLIHELAHAWQSQHHYDPSEFMMNCVKSQAAAATTASRPMVQVGLGIISPALPPMRLGGQRLLTRTSQASRSATTGANRSPRRSKTSSFLPTSQRPRML
jgi:hypothetical protein